MSEDVLSRFESLVARDLMLETVARYVDEASTNGPVQTWRAMLSLEKELRGLRVTTLDKVPWSLMLREDAGDDHG